MNINYAMTKVVAIGDVNAFFEQNDMTNMVYHHIDTHASVGGTSDEILNGTDVIFIITDLSKAADSHIKQLLADISKHPMPILTVAVITTRKDIQASDLQTIKDGINNLLHHVDGLIDMADYVPHEAFSPQTYAHAVHITHNLLKIAINGIAETYLKPGIIGIDYADVYGLLGKAGVIKMGFATASGQNRASVAAKQAIASLMFDGVNFAETQKLLVNITTNLLQPVEYAEVMDEVNLALSVHGRDITVVVGAPNDEAMGESLRVTLFAAN
jgi:cell division protein FtsZ